MIAIIPPPQLANSFVNLLGDGLPGQSPAGTETAVVAKVAAAIRDRAVDVGASEACVDTDFLNSVAKNALKMKVITIITQARREPVIAQLKRSTNLFG